MRFLLDQNFPHPPFDVHALDRRVTYEHFSGHAPGFAKVSTPDWLVYLIARRGDFDGVVTSDRSQIEQDTELIALVISGVHLITWRSGDEDPVTLWGQLLAYTPQILKLLQSSKPAVVTIPNPRLNPRQGFDLTSDLARARKVRDKLSFNERRSAAVDLMTHDLTARGLDDWQVLLKRER
jgi:hypothetical protein